MISGILILSAFVLLLALFEPIISGAKLHAVRVDSGKRNGYPMK